jgi:hypothetical protein
MAPPRLATGGPRLVYSRRMRRFHAALLGLLAVTTTACESCRRRDGPTQKSSAAASASAEQHRPLPPLQAPEPVVTLAVRGQADAVLLIPIGAIAARPLVAVLLASGIGLRQECETLGQAIRREVFVLCQTTRLESRLAASAAGESELVASSLKAALHSVKRKFGQYVASKDLALVGVGDGAEVVASIVRQVPDFFHRVALIDAGFRPWTSVDSVRFIGAGGKALFARCTNEACRKDAMRVVATVKASGIAARLEPEGNTVGATEAPPDLGLALAWLIHAEAGPKGPAAATVPKPEAPAAP